VPTVLLTLPLPEPAPTLLGDAGEVRVIGRVLDTPALRAEVARGVDVLSPQLRETVDDSVLEAGGPQLRAVCAYAVGYNNIDVEAATRRGVVVTNTPGVLTDATADLTLGLIIATARRLCEGDGVMRAGRFDGWAPEFMLGLELRDSLLGLIGVGRIGQAVARRARSCGMRLAYAERERARIDPDLLDVLEPMPIAQLLREADVVSLHVPLTSSTHHLIDASALRSMKRSAVLVNTSRGAVVDEAALVDALQQGWIAGAGLDVYENEPRLAAGLAGCRNAVLVPHLGSATVHTRAAMADLCARNVLAVLKGDLPPNCVNPEAWRDRH